MYLHSDAFEFNCMKCYGDGRHLHLQLDANLNEWPWPSF